MNAVMVECFEDDITMKMTVLMDDKMCTCCCTSAAAAAAAVVAGDDDNTSLDVVSMTIMVHHQQ